MKETERDQVSYHSLSGSRRDTTDSLFSPLPDDEQPTPCLRSVLFSPTSRESKLYTVDRTPSSTSDSLVFSEASAIKAYNGMGFQDARSEKSATAKTMLLKVAQSLGNSPISAAAESTFHGNVLQAIHNSSSIQDLVNMEARLDPYVSVKKAIAKRKESMIEENGTTCTYSDSSTLSYYTADQKETSVRSFRDPHEVSGLFLSTPSRDLVGLKLRDSPIAIAAATLFQGDVLEAIHNTSSFTDLITLEAHLDQHLLLKRAVENRKTCVLCDNDTSCAYSSSSAEASYFTAVQKKLTTPSSILLSQNKSRFSTLSFSPNTVDCLSKTPFRRVTPPSVVAKETADKLQAPDPYDEQAKARGQGDRGINLCDTSLQQTQVITTKISTDLSDFQAKYQHKVSCFEQSQEILNKKLLQTEATLEKTNQDRLFILRNLTDMVKDTNEQHVCWSEDTHGLIGQVSKTISNLKETIASLQKQLSESQRSGLAKKESETRLEGMNDVLRRENFGLATKLASLTISENNLQQENRALLSKISALSDQLAFSLQSQKQADTKIASLSDQLESSLQAQKRADSKISSLSDQVESTLRAQKESNSIIASLSDQVESSIQARKQQQFTNDALVLKSEIANLPNFESLDMENYRKTKAVNNLGDMNSQVRTVQMRSEENNINGSDVFSHHRKIAPNSTTFAAEQPGLKPKIYRPKRLGKHISFADENNVRSSDNTNIWRDDVKEKRRRPLRMSSKNQIRVSKVRAKASRLVKKTRAVAANVSIRRTAGIS